MYSIRSYSRMITDRVRMDAYHEALREMVRPGSTVLDIGTGTGIMALLACRLGAGHVYAVEPSEAIHVARAIAAENGCVDRITFLQDLSTRIELPEKVDLIVSDVRGTLPFLGENIQSLLDARQRHLAPGGSLVPLRDLLQVALVGSRSVFSTYADMGGDLYGLSMTSAWPFVANSLYRDDIRPEHLLLEPRTWFELDYATTTSPHARGKVEWEAACAGTVYGLCVWFDVQLTARVGFSNGPALYPLIYGRSFLPLREPLELQIGDRVEVSIRAHLVADEYVWTWEASVDSPRGRSTSRQSTFEGVPIAPGSLARHDVKFIPRLKEEGQIELAVLQLMDGRRTSEQIAQELAQRFPARFSSVSQAMGRVGALAQKYSS